MLLGCLFGPVYLCIGPGFWLICGTEDLFQRNAMLLSAVGILVTGIVLYSQQFGVVNVLGWDLAAVGLG